MSDRVSVPLRAPTTSDVFEKCVTARTAEYQLAKSAGMFPFGVEMQGASGATITLQGREVIMLGSNNYLGLAGDCRVRQGAIDALDRYGTGCTGSRIMNGTLALHRELEEELAAWVGKEACLVYTTGYSVNLGVISTLVGERDAAFVDTAAHASIVDGARLSAGSLRLFRHNSPTSLRRRLVAWGETGGMGALVAADSVYSMEGDLAPIGELAAVCGDLGARLLVDEAHGLGVLGPGGAGVAAASGAVVDLVMGTFSKSLASCGGFVAGPSSVLDFLQVSCRPFLFTASGVPASLGAALAAVRVARNEPWRREVVLQRAEQLRRGLAELGYKVAASSPSAIVAVHVGADPDALRLWRNLLDQGIYTNCAISPAVPRNGALLRTSVIALHTEAQIDRALSAFELARSMTH